MSCGSDPAEHLSAVTVTDRRLWKGMVKFRSFVSIFLFCFRFLCHMEEAATGVASARASPPPAVEEDPSPQHGDSYDVIDDPSFVSLDDEGFPSQIPYEDAPPNVVSYTSSFAADFYRCGADWSSLLSLEDCRHSDSFDSAPSVKKLKQANLFQVWGFKRNGAVESDSASSIESCKPKRSDSFTDGGQSDCSSERKIVKPKNFGSILRDKRKSSRNQNVLIRERKATKGLEGAGCNSLYV
ncbi:hypothetical protein PIB30_038859 [Stylosanthes scabra]|uniref:Uncharacterized protein n=1 Tax=Stylosanthes scabra TaxID=79078 RepID=A0ABU6WDW1_9FABA|nr:hypothetical protein [Stylosanthes scabra]